MPAFLRAFLRISARRPESPRRPHPLRTQSPGAKDARYARHRRVARRGASRRERPVRSVRSFPLTEIPTISILRAMEVHFTPEQESQLSRIADHSGTGAEQLVKDAALRLVQEDMHFRAGVRRGIEQADRGELVNHNDVKARIERLLQP